jgi:hypothetical protein
MSLITVVKIYFRQSFELSEYFVATFLIHVIFTSIVLSNIAVHIFLACHKGCDRKRVGRGEGVKGSWTSTPTKQQALLAIVPGV